METAKFTSLELTNENKDKFGQQLTTIKTAGQWFCHHFPASAKIYGAPFLEGRTSTVDGFTQTSPIAPNISFMAACLGSESYPKALIYWPRECQFYYYDHTDQKYHATPDSKVGDLVRGYFNRCALEVQRNVNVYSLFTTFCADPIIKSIVERAKSVLRASEDYFSATGPFERVNGIELHERLAIAFVEKLLVAKPQEVMLVASAYDRFAKLIKEKDLQPIKRSQFKDLVTPLIRDRFGSGLRNDLVVADRYQQGWKNLALNTDVVVE